MVHITLTLEDRIAEKLREFAARRGIKIEQAVQEMVNQGLLAENPVEANSIEEDTLIGALAAFRTSEADVSERADEILAAEWKPD